jgi:hypothetical protein
MANAAFTSVDKSTSEDEALSFELSGHEVLWDADGLAMDRARRRGHELGDILAELEVLDELRSDDEIDGKEMANSFGRVFPAVARLLWLGMIRFEGEGQIEYEAILGAVGPQTLSSIPLGAMMDRVFPSADEEIEDNDSSSSEGSGDNEGK